MKKIVIIAIALFTMSASFAQDSGFEKGNMYHLIGLGGQGYWGVGGNNGFGFGGLGWGSNLTVQYQAEWGIHDYVGLGFHAGITAGGFGAFRNPTLYIPLGVQANFHFYQLIADKSSKDILADKIDIYAGLNFGGGPAFIPAADFVFGGIHGGAQIGIRYYPTSNFGIFSEFGYGKSFAQIGIVLR